MDRPRIKLQATEIIDMDDITLEKCDELEKIFQLTDSSKLKQHEWREYCLIQSVAKDIGNFYQTFGCDTKRKVIIYTHTRTRTTFWSKNLEIALKSTKSGRNYLNAITLVEETNDANLNNTNENQQKGSVRQYHAGMTMQDRCKSQSSFRDGKNKIMTTTSAFGMGVDIQDIGLDVQQVWKIIGNKLDVQEEMVNQVKQYCIMIQHNNQVLENLLREQVHHQNQMYKQHLVKWKKSLANVDALMNYLLIL